MKTLFALPFVYFAWSLPEFWTALLLLAVIAGTLAQRHEYRG